eukprot:353783-Chlamydomonas_euryale.AAC.10
MAFQGLPPRSDTHADTEHADPCLCGSFEMGSLPERLPHICATLSAWHTFQSQNRAEWGRLLSITPATETTKEAAENSITPHT